VLDSPGLPQRVCVPAGGTSTARVGLARQRHLHECVVRLQGINVAMVAANVGLNIWLVKALGVKGSAIANVAARYVVFVAMLLIASVRGYYRFPRGASRHARQPCVVASGESAGWM
jgi:hypothetical protein